MGAHGLTFGFYFNLYFRTVHEILKTNFCVSLRLLFINQIHLLIVKFTGLKLGIVFRMSACPTDWFISHGKVKNQNH